MSIQIESPLELHFDRSKNGQIISVVIRVTPDEVSLVIGADNRADAPRQVLRCSPDQWHALRFAAEWYFHALDEAQQPPASAEPGQ